MDRSLSAQFSLVIQLCLTLYDPMDCSTPAFPVHHQLPELPQTHVHWAGDAIQLSDPVIPFFSCLKSFPASGSFPMSQFFTSGGQSTGVSVSASVLPMNIQNWFPLGLTVWISLQSKGLSKFFSNPTVQNHQFFSAQLFCISFSSCPQSFPASGSFPMSQIFESGGRSTGVSVSASVLPMNTQSQPLNTHWWSLQKVS